RQDAGRNVGQATRGEWHDERDRPGRAVLLLRSRGPNCPDVKGAEEAQLHTIHHMPLLSIQITSANRDAHKSARWIPEPQLSSERFRFRKWLIISRGALLRLDLHHLVQPAGNKNSRVLLQAGIFAIALSWH